MKVVVITGSTRGIGFGLAMELLKRDCKVVISGRTDSAVSAAIERLSNGNEGSRISGQSCDVRSEASLQALWDHATDRFGKVDIWVNNAGISTMPDKVWKLSAEEIQAVLDTNILGAILGANVAVRNMFKQDYGTIYFMEGAGSDGSTHPGTMIYGTTKYALDYFFKAFAAELEDSPVLAGAIRPGMVATDLLTEPYRGKPEEWARVKPIFNIIADPIKPVSEWMAAAILDNHQNGKVLKRVSKFEMTLRFIKAPFTKRDPFKDMDVSN
ncbi:MAG: SDR family oxidoreductase [Anaerolineales bacterium]